MVGGAAVGLMVMVIVGLGVAVAVGLGVWVQLVVGFGGQVVVGWALAVCESLDSAAREWDAAGFGVAVRRLADS